MTVTERRRSRPVPGGCLVGIAALVWSAAGIGITLSLIQHWTAPDRQRLQPWFLDIAVALAAAAVVGTGCAVLGMLFWIPGRRRIDEHARALLEEAERGA
jgi:hypothetical protein